MQQFLVLQVIIFWATDLQTNKNVKLDGEVIDGFSMLIIKSYEEAKAECSNAISKGTFLLAFEKVISCMI